MYVYVCVINFINHFVATWAIHNFKPKRNIEKHEKQVGATLVLTVVLSIEPWKPVGVPATGFMQH